MNQALGRPIRSEPALSLSQAVEVARRSRERGSESLSDTDLEAFLHYSAAGSLSEESADNRIADALAAVDTAVRRRVGIWRAATWLSGDLDGKIKSARARAEDALMPPHAWDRTTALSVDRGRGVHCANRTALKAEDPTPVLKSGCLPTSISYSNQLMTVAACGSRLLSNSLPQRRCCSAALSWRWMQERVRRSRL